MKVEPLNEDVKMNAQTAKPRRVNEIDSDLDMESDEEEEEIELTEEMKQALKERDERIAK